MFTGIVYDSLRRLSPYPLRRWLKTRDWFTPLSQRVFGTEVYSKSYFRDIERIESSSVEHIADFIVSSLAPRRVIDVGCGPGHLMAALARRGVDVFGVDISEVGLKSASAKGLRTARFDLTAPGIPLPGAPYDLAISCEVAEHLDARFADEFVTKLAAAAPAIYLTAAEPIAANGPGLYHVNEQPNDYWIARLQAVSYMLDLPATAAARRSLDRPEVVDYLRRPMIFRRSSSGGKSSL